MTSSKTIFISLLLVSLVTAELWKRGSDNSYGDEAVTPKGGGASVAPVAEEEPEVTVAPEGAGAQSVVEHSGYRKKRASSQNSYGDETDVPVGGGAQVPDVSEAPEVKVDNAEGEGAQAAVASSGY